MSYPEIGRELDADDHPDNSHNYRRMAGDIPTIPVSPSLVPEQSPNLEILKQMKQTPNSKSPGTNYQSHPYWKNR